MKKKFPILKLLKVILTGSLVIFCFFFLVGIKTSASYESNIKGEENNKIATWNININNENITDTYDKVITISDINWNNSHTDSSKVSPSSSGAFTLEIDPMTTDVAFTYELKYIDKTIDDKYLLTITSSTSSDGYFIHTSNDTYTGLFSLSDIKNKTKKIITVNLSWINNDSNNENDTSISDTTEEVKYINLVFTAKQYNGEKIIEYTP